MRFLGLEFLNTYYKLREKNQSIVLIDMKIHSAINSLNDQMFGHPDSGLAVANMHILLSEFVEKLVNIVIQTFTKLQMEENGSQLHVEVFQK